jgi:hypothetical protein
MKSPHIRMAAHRRLRALSLLLLGAGALLQVSCQSPTETPPSSTRTITIQVQNGLAAPLPLVPVAMYDGTKGEVPDALLEQQVTDQSGFVRFRRTIPTTGAPFLFVVGDDVTGRIRLSANVLCRDTVMVVILQTADIPCGGAQNYQLIIDDVCAMNSLGQRFTDSTEMIFRSSCDIPLTFTFTPPAPADQAWMRLFDASGAAIAGQPFTIPPRGAFSIRAFASPKDSGVLHYPVVFTGTGTAGVTVTLTIDIEVRARNCNRCFCDNDSVIVDYGLVQVGTKMVRSATLPLNECLYNRLDQILQGLSDDVFKIVDGPVSIVPPGNINTVKVQFEPRDLASYERVFLVEHSIPEENKVCTTRVVLRGQGCGPVCLLETSNLIAGDPDNKHQFQLQLVRTRVDERSVGRVCLRNTGRCGDLVINGKLEWVAPGFSLSPAQLTIPAGGSDCFDVRFDATDQVVWPNGHGKPAVVNHDVPLIFDDCSGNRSVHMRVVVDTIPIEFSRCIYQWDQNQNYGYNFTPAAGKGEDRFDPDILNTQVSDIGVMLVVPGLSADVLMKSGWKLIKTNVSEAQFNWDDMSRGVNGWTRAEYVSITTEPPNFTMGRNATLTLRSVYSVRIDRSGDISYACIRVREVSMDGDGKLKMCLDVLYPMIKEQ